MRKYDKIHDSLRIIRGRLPLLVKSLNLQEKVDLDAWTNVLDSKLLPRVAPDFPLMVAICGGGSTGKSTLFNSLLQQKVAPIGGKAGLSRRILVAGHPDVFGREKVLENLFEPFGTIPAPLNNIEELTEPGYPLYVSCEAVPKSLVLMDTPDFDTGSAGEYVNRRIAKPVLEASDILVYIFTNATYNNLENTKFMAKTLTQIGQRKCLLIYRAYKSYTDKEVIVHSQTVVDNLYGDQAKKYLLGIYRTDDCNDVAAGSQFMQTSPVRQEGEDIMAVLQKLDPREERERLIKSILESLLIDVNRALTESKITLDELRLYTSAVRLAQSHAIKRASQSFPSQQVLQRTYELWLETSPRSLKAIRRINRVVGAPFRGIIRVRDWVKTRTRDQEGNGRPPVDPIDKLKEDLLAAANDLRRDVLATDISAETTKTDPEGKRMIALVDSVRKRRKLQTPQQRPFYEKVHRGRFNIYVMAHEAIKDSRRQLQGRSWGPEIKDIESIAEDFKIIPDELTRELTSIVHEFRQNMTILQKTREQFFAYVNIVPTVIALTYVFATSDPGGGTAVYAHLSGVFGLTDLWALIAIPPSAGLDEVSRRKLEELLKPITEQWFRFRAQKVESILENRITGDLIGSSQEIEDKATRLVSEIENSIECCRF